MIHTQEHLLAGNRAAPPRTLVDVLRTTVREHPEASALDDGNGALSYRELMARVIAVSARLIEAGVHRGDRVGVRMASGSRELYISILGILAAGAAYVPVDADDPEERAELVFGEAAVQGVISGTGIYAATDGSTSAPLFDGEPPHPSTSAHPMVQAPDLGDDAWIIFTSGSTGVPKGVAITHRSAAAFVDAEAHLFLRDEPLAPGDRVLAGLSVAFDASCEEMWLAWRHGACLVPAPRALVRSGMDLGPWLTARGITVVSTVPTLAALWPAESLENVRLLIFGGEACPAELAERLAVEGREVWNTYGPTEATVVACAAPLDGSTPVRIGLPLAGWDLAVVDAEGHPVAEGEVGELIIGGIGLGRYLDPGKDAEKYAPHPQLGWERAYRSGDLVRYETAGLVFQGRADDQIKLGGRRIELGEIESALQNLPGVSGAAAAVQTTPAATQVLVGYVVPTDREEFDTAAALTRLRQELPAALIPVLALIDDLPVRTSGKVDRAALPWPLSESPDDHALLDVDQRLLAQQWEAVLGVPVTSPSANFFDLGGGSLAAAQLVARIRQTDPEFTVAEVYAQPRLGAMADTLAARREVAGDSQTAGYHRVSPTPALMRWAQTLLALPLGVLSGGRWLTYALVASTVLQSQSGFGFLPAVSPLVLVLLIVIFGTPFGRMLITVLCARLLLRRLQPGDYPRGGSVHLRLWVAEQVALQIGAASLAGAPWNASYARALGAKINRGADLHSLPPITGMLTVGEGAAIEPEVDLSGYWLDGDILRVGAIRVGADSVVGTRSALLPGTRIGKNAEIVAGSAVFGRVPAGQLWAGSPAQRVGTSTLGTCSGWWLESRPPRGRRWLVAYGASSLLLALMPITAFVLGALIVVAGMRGAPSLEAALGAALLWGIPGALVAGLALAALILVWVRLMGAGLREGVFPVRSRSGWQTWSTHRALDLARTALFPLYSSLLTPTWLRLLGARVGRDVEASTVLLIPGLTTIRDGAFLADDTLIGAYQLGGGWMRVGAVEVGKRAFVGNSGMAGVGHRVPKDGLVAVLSSAPRKSKAGSSWLGSPAVRLRRTVAAVDDSRTFRPPRKLRLARALWEASRVVPAVLSYLLPLAVIGALLILTRAAGPGAALLISGVVMAGAAIVAALLATIAKWLLVGRIRAGEHPLWSSFVWRAEAADAFIEMIAAPWFAEAALGTPSLVWWLRSMGSTIGRGVWCETYWLPEADLVTIEDGATVNRGCVVQTHLFHDRIMSMDMVTLGSGATLGPHSVTLPASHLGAHSTVGPSSLVMRGEMVPEGSRWSGNPIGPWRDVRVAGYHPKTR